MLWRRPHVLLGVSGSVAAIKVPIIAQLLSEFCEVVVVATDASRKLLPVEQLKSMNLSVKGAPRSCKHRPAFSSLRGKLCETGAPWAAAVLEAHSFSFALSPLFILKSCSLLSPYPLLRLWVSRYEHAFS